MLRVRADLIDRFVNEAGEVSIARGADRRRDARHQERALRPDRERQPAARAAARDRDPGRDPDAARDGGSAGHGRARSTRSSSTASRASRNSRGCWPRASTTSPPSSRRLLKVDSATRDRAPAQARLTREPAAEPDARAHGAVREHRQRPALPRRAPGRQGDRQARGTRAQGRPASRSTAACSSGSTAPFEHLLRNAVAHGIEPTRRAPRRRQARDSASWSSRCARRATRSCSTVTDDGAGLNYARIRSKAVASAACCRPTTSRPTRELAQLIFTPGFSTAAEVTSSPAAASAWTW